MAELSEEHQIFIVQALACYRTPSEVSDLVKAEFRGLEIDRRQVQFYDPTKGGDGKRLAKEWRDLFAATRKTYLEDIASIGIAQQAHRLRMLDEMARDAKQKKNYQLAAQLIEQAAKETGGSFTNRRKLEIDDPRKVLADILGVSPTEIPDDLE